MRWSHYCRTRCVSAKNKQHGWTAGCREAVTDRAVRLGNAQITLTTAERQTVTLLRRETCDGIVHPVNFRMDMVQLVINSAPPPWRCPHTLLPIFIVYAHKSNAAPSSQLKKPSGCCCCCCCCYWQSMAVNQRHTTRTWECRRQCRTDRLHHTTKTTVHCITHSSISIFIQLLLASIVQHSARSRSVDYTRNWHNS